MNARFERSGPLTELASYPQWAQDMAVDADIVKKTVVDHEILDRMRETPQARNPTRSFMLGIWPVIERFPGYMAHSLLKTRYGRSVGDDLARRWLVRNIRVEQNHAEYWLDWAAGAGVPRNAVLRGEVADGTAVLADWCEDISSNGTLAASIAATNYAVEGATGEWAQILYSSEKYTTAFAPESRNRSLRWLKLHAAYDDTHPWEALEIVCTLIGTNPAVAEVQHLGDCVKRSYASMRMLADRCVMESRVTEVTDEVAA